MSTSVKRNTYNDFLFNRKIEECATIKLNERVKIIRNSHDDKKLTRKIDKKSPTKTLTISWEGFVLD